MLIYNANKGKRSNTGNVTIVSYYCPVEQPIANIKYRDENETCFSPSRPVLNKTQNSAMADATDG